MGSKLNLQLAATLVIFWLGQFHLNTNAEEFDITTIYRFQRGITEDQRTLLNITGNFANLGDCYADDCNWSRQGWKVINTAQANVHTPGYKRLEAPQLNTFILEPLQPLWFEKGITVSISSPSEDGEALLYFSTGDDVLNSDLYIIVIPFYNKRSNRLRSYECVEYESTTFALEYVPRKCSRLTTEDSYIFMDQKKPTYIHIRSNTEGKLEIAFLEQTFQLGIRHDRKLYFGVNCTNSYTVFHMSEAANVFALQKSQGHFDRAVFSREPVCISIEYYLEMKSSARFDVKVILENSTELSLGSAVAKDYIEEQVWKTHIFYMDEDPSLKLSHLKIIAKRYSDCKLFIKRIRNCNHEDENSLATINRECSIEIHARNNAFGLPFMSQDGENVLNSNIAVDFEPCTAMKDDCNWKLTNFTMIDDSPPLILSGKYRNSIGVGERTKPRLFIEELQISLSTRDSTGRLQLYLLESNTTDLNYVHMYYIKISDGEIAELWKCATSYSVITVAPGIDRYCDDRKQYERLSDSYWQNHPYVFSMKVKDDEVKLSLKTQTDIQTIFAWDDSNPLDIKYYSVGMDSMKGDITINEIDTQRSLSATSVDASIISPSFIPNYRKVCESVVSNGLTSYGVQIVKINDETIDLEKKQGTPLSDGWMLNIYHGEITGENIYSPIAIKLSTTNFFNNLKIQRIAGCNSEGLDGDLHVVSGKDVKVMDFQSYEAAVKKSFPQEQETEELQPIEVDVYCENGGLFDKKTNRCICPPGFTGPTCEIGCGADRYGSKCGGRCSRTEGGCTEMKLCRPILGCSCAPGLKGLLCDTLCDEFEYGAGCKQKCGRCFSGVCDKYTGECSSGCHEGFYPPTCHQSYKYLKTAPEIKAVDFGTLEVTYNVNPGNMKGKGNPKFHQLQIKEEATSHDQWKELTPVLLENGEDTVEANITNLTSKLEYQVRVVLLDEDGNSYQAMNIPLAKSFTKCLVPNEVFYNLSSLTVEENKFGVQWQYDDNVTWCKLSHFEVDLNIGWKWQQHYSGIENSYTFFKMLPGEMYNVRVRAITVKGPAVYSEPFTVTTKDKAPGKVTALKVHSKTCDQLRLEWQQPFDSRGKIQGYRVSYECLRFLACDQTVSCSHFKGQVDVVVPSTTLRGLQPHAQYKINVYAKTSVYGTPAFIIATTDVTVPGVSPTAVSAAVIKSNTSLTVQWKNPDNCTSLNGYIQGYLYELYSSTSQTPNQEGETKDTSVTFKGLIPHTNYQVKVYLITQSGINHDNPLVINASTRATVPGKVQQLTVYKTGRVVLGLRWTKPTETYGDIRSFTISYGIKDRQATNTIIKPTPCNAWPNMFCHTIKSLKPDTQYFITVQARNTEVAEDGEFAEIRATTKEQAPLAPSYIKTVSQTETNLTIEWGLPRMLNGVLRSFIVNIEQTDAYNTSSCCQNFSVQEIHVRYEQASYQTQFNNLKPASTYLISVTAKTTALGPAVSLTAHTRPSLPSMKGILELAESSELEISSSPSIIVHPAKEYKELVMGYLLVVIPEAPGIDIQETSLQDDWIAQELREKINGTFYVAAELNQANMEEKAERVLGIENEVKNGNWSELWDPPLEDGKEYRIGLVMILDYCGVFNIGYVETETLTVNEYE